jgi:hypothetical protein
MTIKSLSSFLAATAIGFTVLNNARAATAVNDTLDLDVTFIGDREVLLQDAHKQLHWPEAASIGTAKPSFSYSVIPKRLNVEPEWTRNGPIRLKINDPLSRLYKGYVNVGMGNFLSPLLHVSFSDVRSRSKSWGVQFKHKSTDGGFVDDDAIEQAFSTNHLDGYYRKLWKNEAMTFSSSFDRENISLYGGEPMANSLQTGVTSSYNYQVIANRLNLSNRQSSRARWQHNVTLNHDYLWSSHHAEEHNFDLSANLSGLLDTIPASVELHVNVDRLNQPEEGLKAKNERQAIFDLHPQIRKDFGPIKTSIGLGMWIDAQGKQPFLIAPEIEATVSLLRDLFIPYVRIDGGVRQNRYQRALRSNPFVNLPMASVMDTIKTWHNTYETIHATAGMRGSITRSFTFNINAEFKRNNQHLFWVPQYGDGDGRSFIPLYQDINITSLNGDAAWKLGKSTELLGHVAQHNYRIRDSLTNVQEAWFMPRLELEAALQHTIKGKLRVKANLLIQTGRKGLASADEGDLGTIVNVQSNGPAIGSASSMSNITMLNIQAEYLYNARLSGWLKLNNALNQVNPFLTGYDSQGIRFQMGASYAF